LGKKGFSAFNIKIPAWKRILDICVSLAVLLVLWPLFLLVAAYIKIVSPGPVFFRQIRVGYGGKPFSFIKFRSMKYGNDQGTHQSHIVTRIRSDNPLMKLDSQDKRIIPGGRFLRKACIDELPQILHVLRGEMSLVGPRPCLPYEATEFLHWHNHRFDVLPGMTGLWQVSGKNKLTFTQMLRLDISYANNMSLWNDIKIIFLTIPAIFNLVTENIASKIKKQTALTEEPSREQAIS
jgi:lipopolysaccharide/colanic/teichoic acid biosynthesis glycosyltransferase